MKKQSRKMKVFGLSLLILCLMAAVSTGIAAAPSCVALTDPTRVFPLPQGQYSPYESGFGDGRSFGGARSHEGIDIIAPEGTPVYSVCNGVVTNKGWLTLGGWRIGVMDAFGVYHYYAHLSQYADLEVGDPVSAGQLLGYVGSTGYGPEGTSDQMVSHLHFGLYMNDVAFDAYPYLVRWEGK
ncbi:MAG: M23 family metallopeptidase [Oscillospiraceae bacterium]|nr:M23 family metallopeptidase [Oscillospiraceae bacterium]